MQSQPIPIQPPPGLSERIALAGDFCVARPKEISAIMIGSPTKAMQAR